MDSLKEDLIAIYEEILFGTDARYGALDKLDGYYAGAWDDKLAEARAIKAALKADNSNSQQVKDLTKQESEMKLVNNIKELLVGDVIVGIRGCTTIYGNYTRCYEGKLLVVKHIEPPFIVADVEYGCRLLGTVQNTIKFSDYVFGKPTIEFIELTRSNYKNRGENEGANKKEEKV